MRDISILALFGIDIEDLELYEEVDSSDESVAFRVRTRKGDARCAGCGSARMATTIIRFKRSGIGEFKRVGETFENWRTEIENSYLPVVGGKRITNAGIEGRNNKTKTLKKACYGLTNFEDLRKRVFLIFGKDPTKRQ